MAGSGETEDLVLAGWDVLAVGLRQAWPFVTFGAPIDERDERTLWIDTDFSVTDESGSKVTGSPLTRLERLILLIVRDVALGRDDLVLRFDDGSSLAISNAPNASDSNSWWISASSTSPS
jgi:hypothetical protein